jgi:hypothetical protein
MTPPPAATEAGACVRIAQRAVDRQVPDPVLPVERGADVVRGRARLATGGTVI